MMLLLQALFRLRGQVLAYGIGLAAWAGIEVMLFPQLENSFGEMDYPEEILQAFGVGDVGLGDPRGFFGAEFFSLGPLVLGAFIVFAATAALAGEEASGTMEFLASLPISRVRLFVQKTIAVIIAAAGIAALTSVGWAVTVPFIDLGRELTLWDLVRSTFLQMPFVAFMTAVGLLLGAVAPSRSSAAAWTGAVLIIAYLLVAIGSTVDSVKALKYVSPYYYADLSGILVDGVTAWHQLVLWSATGALALLALQAFEARELGGERWQFEALWPAWWWSTPMMEPGPAATSPSGEPAAPTGAPRQPGGSTMRFALLLAVVALGAAGAGAAARYAITRPSILSISGRVDAPSEVVLSPASGRVTVLTIAEGQDVKRGQAVAWIADILDNQPKSVIIPRSGRVTSLSLREGQFAVVATPALVVHELDALNVMLEVDEDDVGRVAVGQPVDLSFGGLGLQMTASVGSIASVPTANPAARPGQSRKYEVKIPLPDARDPRVIVGLPVEARVYVARAR